MRLWPSIGIWHCVQSICLWPVLVIYKQGLCYSNGEIKRLMIGSHRTEISGVMLPPGPVDGAEPADGLLDVVGVGLHAALADAQLPCLVQPEQLTVARSVTRCRTCHHHQMKPHS
jgi:hypothetical protein